MDMVTKGIEDLTYRFLKNNPDLSEKQIRQKFLDMNKDFNNDELFNSLFPSIYGIVLCNIKLGQVEKYDQQISEVK